MEVVTISTAFLFITCNTVSTKDKNGDINSENKSPNTELKSQEPISKSKEKTLFFEQKISSTNAHEATYELVFEGDKVQVKYKGYKYAFIDTAEFKNGQVVNKQFPNLYSFRDNSFCIYDEENGNYDCYAFVKAKSSNTIDEIINPNTNKSRNRESNDSNTLTLREVQLTLLDAGEKKMNLYLGKPDYSEMLAYGAGTVAVYVNRIKENGKVLDLAIGFQNGRITSIQALITKYHKNN